ncbi:flavodoxin domain-containing protein [Amycolatopsis sp.]|uniref:flavodoxin domain-containing protein n=1 Tax=Amycolatopsis sp. TaxID=37632 RepID=UPI002D7FAF17|nr:flavodoxin domain-containing protein [Amycolatopsis sp.]HET6703325.1 flavodoxin domain-containing protein [Amycolatopsis sp.]
MRILVAVATRHGDTREIAEHLATSLGSALTDAGVAPEVEVRDVGLVSSPAGFDAVVLGSSVHRGQWLGPARNFAESFSDGLRRLPVWLFSSGPVDEEHEPAREIARQLVARDHRVFDGTADRPLIRAWGHEIGATLAAAVAGSAT